jgi:hypothetical protein
MGNRDEGIKLVNLFSVFTEKERKKKLNKTFPTSRFYAVILNKIMIFTCRCRLTIRKILPELSEILKISKKRRGKKLIAALGGGKRD